MHESHNILRITRTALLAAVLGTLTLVGAHAVSAKSTVAPTWLTVNTKAHTASLTIIAGYNSAIAGFNFNGYGQGKMVVSIPVGYKVTVVFSNKGGLPHSVEFVKYSQKDAGSYAPAFHGASSPNPTVGIGAGPTQKFSFVTKPTGVYAFVCAVPGHEPAGMWDTLKVIKSGKPAITFLH